MDQADYPGALWVPAHPSNFRQAGRLGYTDLVIHYTSGRRDPKAVAAMWQEPHHGSSAHFVIGSDATVIQSVRLTDIAYHAHAANATSVGIEHCCRKPGELGPNDPGLPPTADQMLASARLVAWLMAQRDLDVSCIKGHAQIDPETTHADCPEGGGAGIVIANYIILVKTVIASGNF